MMPVSSILVAHAEPDLPLSTEVAVPILALGLLVLVAVAYDAYRVYDDRVAPETDQDNV